MQTILIIDDHRMITDPLTTILSTNFTVTVARSAKEMRACLAQQGFDLALLDLELRDGSCGIDLLAELNQAKVPAVILSGTATDNQLKNCYDMNICGFVNKEMGCEEVILATHRAIAGDWMFPPGFQARMRGLSHDKIPKMSNTEVKIINLLCRTTPLQSNQDIAQQLHLSYGTVKNNMVALYQKFNVKGRDNLVSEVRRRGYFLPHQPNSGIKMRTQAPK
jgi:DNA-binding NarL/FixJ family response regulator